MFEYNHSIAATFQSRIFVREIYRNWRAL